MTAVTPAITSIIREMKGSTEGGTPQLARIKWAWRSASRAHLSKLTAPIKWLQAVSVVFPLAALTAIALDAAQFFQGPHRCFSPVESDMAGDLSLFIVALWVSIFSFLVQQNIEARARELDRVIDELATDLVISFLEDGGKPALACYHPGKWMQIEGTKAAGLSMEK
jgi:hypothetical protein